MSQYWICPLCQAHLDPGEKCDCQEQKEREEAERRSLFQQDSNSGQLKMAFVGHNEKVV